ncbi:MAG: ABC transporter substrate-binding protein [Deltaproteobacteria bacterium]|nr:ABC transporter substrate-binding protein [Deltaproteobacteria bacterium]
MNTIKKCTILFFVLIISLVFYHGNTQNCFAEETTKTFSTTPVKKKNGKWRIGYLEGGNYSEYHTTMDATIKGLMELGWIEKKELPTLQGATGKSQWNYYATKLESEYLEFIPNGFYTSNWKQKLREETASKFIARLNNNDMDLVFAMGTWAGIDLSKRNHTTPTLVLAVSDAVASGIIKSIHDSGNDFIHARVDPDRFERQVRIFQTVIGFQSLGMIYRNDIEGRSYAAVDKVKKVARERGFRINTCFLADSAELADDEQRLIQCFKELVKTVDAIYVTAQKAVNKNTTPILADIAKQTRIPTFSQAGHQDVKKGLLLSISQAGFKYVGKFYAETMAKILNGAKPGRLNQIFQDPSKIAINLSTAEAIAFYPSLDILSSADEIYIEKQDEK